MTARPRTRPATTLAVVCIATAMLMLDIAVINSALPRVAVDLRSSLSGVTWIIDAYTLALAATVLTTGSLADRYGRRRTFVVGLVVFTASSVVCALSTSIVQLDVARAVQGIGAAAMFSTSLALLATAYPDWTARAKALAVYGATIGASFAVGPLVGGAMTSWFGWRSVFWLNVPIGVACVLGALAVAESRDPHPRRPDWAGQLLSGGAMFLLVLALLRGNEVGWTARATVLEFVGAGLLAVAFVVAESRITEPMLPLGLFKDRTFTGIQLAAFGISSSLFAIFVYLTFYLQGVAHLSPIESGLAYVPGTALSFVVAAASASMVTRVDSRLLLTVGLLFVAAGMAFGFLLHADSSWTALLPAELVSMFGCGIVNPVLSGLVLSASPRGQEALAVGVNDAARQAGIALGVAVLGAMIPSRALAGGHGEAAYVTGLHHAAWVATGVALFGALAAWVLIRPSQQSGPKFEVVDAVATQDAVTAQDALVDAVAAQDGQLAPQLAGIPG
jgi:EmrB/QacA subfamily drug resistance transporter